MIEAPPSAVQLHMSRPRVPQFHATGRWWPSDELASVAAGWRDAIDEQAGPDAVCAVAVPSTADGLALLAAGSGRSSAVPVLAADPEFWPDRAPLFDGMPLALPPAIAGLADEARRRGFVPLLLGPSNGAVRTPVEPLRTPGFVIHTSGSTGVPKPVYRPTSHIIEGARVRARALGLRDGDGLVGGVPFSSGQGVVQVVTAMILQGALGMVGPVDYREVLTTLSLPQFACWRATAHYADVLGRCALRSVPRAPRVCLISSPVGEPVHRAFASRFGVPLRGAYSSTETGAIAVDAAPDAEVQAGTVGRPLPGVDVAIGEHPHTPAPTGTVGRVWVRSPWQMAGYGLPPHVERPGEVNGWWPTRDLGALDEAGRLRLAGRIDDCVRTREGRLVNLEAVAAALRNLRGVRAAVVLPLESAAGTSFGAVLQGEPGLSLDDVRRAAGAALASWALPRAMHLVPELPRLPNGKPDRLACMVLLAGGATA